MRNAYLFALFLVLACVQIAIPATMIVQRERILRDGTQYRFRCAPVNLANALRRGYVALELRAASLESPANTSLYPGQRAYARIEVDDNGFARLNGTSTRPPSAGDYVSGLVLWGGRGGARRTLSLPFDRYYLDGLLAIETKEAVRHQRLDGDHQAYVAVRVLRGQAFLEELYIDDQPIRVFLRGQAKTP